MGMQAILLILNPYPGLENLKIKHFQMMEVHLEKAYLYEK